jgi:tetratricopeptide (TPR) repeat protein
VVIAPFDGRRLRFRDATVTPKVVAGRYEFLVEPDGESPRTLTVDGVIGRGHMEGGGTQGFVTRAADGTYRFLPFDYSRHGREWFCNTNSRTNRGWVPITASLRLAACGDWPPARVLGDVARFANCQGCHASQLDVAFDTTAHRYASRYATLAIDCESCHGPGRRHVELARAADGRMPTSSDIGMRALATLNKDQSMAVCFQCHAIKDQLRPGYLSGDALERYYSLSFPLLGDIALAPDGRVRTFAYQESHRYSDCYLSGGMRCTDCHDPHSQTYRDVDGARLVGRFDDRQCTSCHASKADSVALVRHTHHPLASPGSRCVSCHMPYLQHPEIGSAIRYARSDHSIPIPRPAFDNALGVQPACSSCHSDRALGTLEADVARWYGVLKPHKGIIAAQLGARSPSGATAATTGGLATAAALLAPDDSATPHSVARFAGLARLLDRYLAGDSASVGPIPRERLDELATDSATDVRALALATLHLLSGREARTRRQLVRALEREGAHDGALRDRWGLALGYAGDRYLSRGELGRAIDAYRAALEVRPDQSRTIASLANAERDAGQLTDAIADYGHSLALERRQSGGGGGIALTLVNLGLAREAAGDSAGAVMAWRDAARLDPNEPLARFNLGNALLLHGQTTNAIAEYRAAVTLDGSLAPAFFNLSRAYALEGRFDEALRAVRQGLRFDSTDAGARELRSQLESRLR